MKPGHTHLFSTIKHILIVDDEVEFAKSITRHLKRKGFDLRIAHDGLQALDQLDLAAQDKQTIDLVVSDVIMPNLDGIQLLKQIKSRYPLTSVILLTGFGENPVARGCVRDEMDDFYQKPIKPSEMLDLIERVDKKRRALRLGRRNSKTAIETQDNESATC